MLIYLLILIPILINVSQTKEDFCIGPLPSSTYIDTVESNNNIYRLDIYLVSGFSRKESYYKKIDEFVCKNLDTNVINKCHDFSIVFYKKTKSTHIENITNSPEDFDKFSDYDQICEYRWYDGVFDRKEVMTGEYPLFTTYKDNPCN